MWARWQVDEETLQDWVAVLNRVDGSVLWLIRFRVSVGAVAGGRGDATRRCGVHAAESVGSDISPLSSSCHHEHALSERVYRGRSLIRKRPSPRTTIGP